MTLCWIFSLTTFQLDAASNLISWFLVFSFTKNIKQSGDRIFSCASSCQKLPLYGIILQSYCTIRRVNFYAPQCILTIDMISLYQLPALTAFALLASSFFATSCSVTFKHGSVCWHLVVILLPCLVMPVKRPSRLGLGAPPSSESFISLFMNANQRRWRRLFINIHDTSVRHSSAVDNAINTSLSKTRQRQSDYFLLSAISALYVPCLWYTNTLPHWCDSDRNHRSLN